MSMKKSMIALAVASVFVAPAAMAEATVYGQFNLAIDMYDAGTTPSTSANQMNSYASRVGVKGSDSLDHGITLDYQLEGGVDVDNPGNFGFDRQSNLGLSNDMGTVRLGLQDSPYKAVSRKLDLFGDSVADIRNDFMGVARAMGNGHDDSAADAVSYKSPSMGGFTVVAASGFTNEVPLPSGADKSTALGFAAMYEQGPIFAAVASSNFDDGATGGVENSAFKVGGSYTMDAIQVNAAFENISDTVATVETTSSNLYLGAKYNLSSTSAVKAAYTSIGEEEVGGVASDNAETRLSLGYDHGLSKNTSVYALYTAISSDVPLADEPSVISLGIKHAF